MCYMLLSMFSCFTRIRKLASLHNLAIILDKIITLPFIRFSICNPFRAIKCTLTRQRFNRVFLFLNPHYHNSGYYEVANFHGPSRTNRRSPSHSIFVQLKISPVPKTATSAIRSPSAACGGPMKM